MSREDLSNTQGAQQQKWFILLLACIALFMIMLDVSVVNVALSAIQTSLNAGTQETSWFLNAYTLVFASCLILGGRLVDEWGNGRAYRVALLIFGLGSLLCAFSFNSALLISARAFQALGAALVMPVTLSMVTVAFPIQQRGMAMGIWGAVSGVAFAVGPALGGILTHALSWHWIFFINIPIVVMGFLASMFILPYRAGQQVEGEKATGFSLDIIGCVLGVSSLMLTALALTWFETNRFALLLLVVAAALFALLYWYETSKARNPLISFELFHEKSYACAVLVGLFLMFGQMGLFYVLPLYLQNKLVLSPMMAGMSLIPMTVVMLIATPICGRMADKIASQKLISIGILLCVLAYAGMAFSCRFNSSSMFIVPLLIIGLGFSLIQTPLTSAAMQWVPRGKEGAGSSMLTTARQVGSLLGVALLTLTQPEHTFTAFIILATIFAICFVVARGIKDKFTV